VNQATADAVLSAAAYVDARGDALARARAAALIGRAPAADAVAQLAPERSDAASLRAALEVCDDLRALEDPRAEAWARELASGQARDGGFAPGLPSDVRWFETGMIAGQLAKTRCARPASLLAAADFLARDFSPERVQGGSSSWGAIAAHAHCFANVDHDASDAILQWCGRELSRGFLTRAFDAVRTARVLVWCDAHGLPGAQLAREDLLIGLLTEQESDGGFAAWGDRDAVASTLDGLVALRRLGG